MAFQEAQDLNGSPAYKYPKFVTKPLAIAFAVGISPFLAVGFGLQCLAQGPSATWKAWTTKTKSRIEE